MPRDETYLEVYEDDSLIDGDDDEFAAPRRVLQRDYPRSSSGCECRCCAACCQSAGRAVLSLVVFATSVALCVLGGVFVGVAVELKSSGAAAALAPTTELGAATLALAVAGLLELANGGLALCGVCCREPCGCSLALASFLTTPAAALDVALALEVAARAAPLAAAVAAARRSAGGDFGDDDAVAGATRGLPRETAIRWLALGLLGALLLNVVRHRAAAGLRALNASDGGPTDDDLEERRKRREDALTIRHVKTKYADMNARMHKKYQA